MQGQSGCGKSELANCLLDVLRNGTTRNRFEASNNINSVTRVLKQQKFKDYILEDHPGIQDTYFGNKQHLSNLIDSLKKEPFSVILFVINDNPRIDTKVVEQMSYIFSELNNNKEVLKHFAIVTSKFSLTDQENQKKLMCATLKRMYEQNAKNDLPSEQELLSKVFCLDCKFADTLRKEEGVPGTEREAKITENLNIQCFKILNLADHLHFDYCQNLSKKRFPDCEFRDLSAKKRNKIEPGVSEFINRYEIELDDKSFICLKELSDAYSHFVQMTRSSKKCSDAFIMHFNNQVTLLSEVTICTICQKMKPGKKIPREYYSNCCTCCKTKILKRSIFLGIRSQYIQCTKIDYQEHDNKTKNMEDT